MYLIGEDEVVLIMTASTTLTVELLDHSCCQPHLTPLFHNKIKQFVPYISIFQFGLPGIPDWAS